MEGAVKALCNRLVVAEMSSHPSKDLAEQCIKVLARLRPLQFCVCVMLMSAVLFVCGKKNIVTEWE